jgi:hypothetical protein
VATKCRLSTDDARAAVGFLLGAVETGGDIYDALDQVRPLHPKDNTFPGEVFMRLAAEALGLGGVSAERPLSSEGLVERYLPECGFRGKDASKLRYALLAAAATHGGVEVELFDEVAYWGTDDFWSYAGLGAVAWARAVADERGLPLAELCQQLQAQHPGPLSE